MNFPEIVQLAVAGAAVIGTGGWLTIIIRSHERRIKAAEDGVAGIAADLNERVTYPDCAANRKDCPVSKIKDNMPKDLRTRVRVLEAEKLSITDHAAFCSGIMKNIENQVAHMTKAIDDHHARLGEGEKLFRELSELAGAMKQHIKSRS